MHDLIISLGQTYLFLWTKEAITVYHTCGCPKATCACCSNSLSTCTCRCISISNKLLPSTYVEHNMLGVTPGTRRFANHDQVSSFSCYGCRHIRSHEGIRGAMTKTDPTGSTWPLLDDGDETFGPKARAREVKQRRPHGDGRRSGPAGSRRNLWGPDNEGPLGRDAGSLRLCSPLDRLDGLASLVMVRQGPIT